MKPWVLFGAAMAIVTTVSAQGIRKWRTLDGDVHFGDDPPPGSVLLESDDPWSGDAPPPPPPPPAAPRREASFPRSAAGEDDGRAGQASAACRREISARLHDPNGVDFASGEQVSQLGGSSFTVSGSLTAENAYGRAVQSSWSCEATLVSVDRWRVSLSFRDAGGTDVRLSAAEAPPASPSRRSYEPALPSTGMPPPVSSGSIVSRPADALPSYEPPLDTRRSPSGRSVDFVGEPKIVGTEFRPSVDFCVQNYTTEWRKVTIRVQSERHSIGFVGPNKKECASIDTASLSTFDAKDLAIEDRVASEQDLRQFGVGR